MAPGLADVGIVGVNGGYFQNPDLQFGVNCYGKKPDITSEDEERMQNTVPYPQNAKEVALDNRVADLKGRLGEVIVSPFNDSKWSEF